MQVNNKLDTRPVVDIWPVVAPVHKYAIYRLLVSFDVYGFSTTILQCVLAWLGKKKNTGLWSSYFATCHYFSLWYLALTRVSYNQWNWNNLCLNLCFYRSRVCMLFVAVYSIGLSTGALIVWNTHAHTHTHTHTHSLSLMYAHTFTHVASMLYTCTHTHNVISVLDTSHLAAMTVTSKHCSNTSLSTLVYLHS